MSQQTTIEIHPRAAGKSSAARSVRRGGLIPGVLYGQGREPLAIQIEVPALRGALTGDGGRHAILTLHVAGEQGTTAAVLKEYQLDKVRSTIIHVDLMAISLTEKLSTQITVHIEGEARGIIDGGVLDQNTHELEIETLPADLPDAIVVDVSDLGVGDSIKVGDLTPPSGVTFLSDPELVVVSVTTPSTMEQIEAEQAAEAGDVVVEDAEAAPAADEPE